MKLSFGVVSSGASSAVRQSSEDLASDQSSEDDFCGIADSLKAGVLLFFLGLDWPISRTFSLKLIMRGAVKI